MKLNEKGFDEEYYEMMKDDYYISKHSSEIDNLWKYILLNKISLVTTIDDEDAFADIYTDLGHTKKNGFGRFKRKKE